MASFRFILVAWVVPGKDDYFMSFFFCLDARATVATVAQVATVFFFFFSWCFFPTCQVRV